MRRTGVLMLLLLLLPAPGFALVPGDGPVFARIEALRPVAASVVIDGVGSDWGDIPSFPDPSGDAGGDATRDITSVAIAPTADALLVKIEMAGTPASGSIWIDVDFMSLQFRDYQIGFFPFVDDVLRIFEEGQPSVSFDWEHATSVYGSVVEISVPYAELDAALPASMQGRLSGGAARSWVRVTPFSVGGPVDDFGAAVGSFRLVQTPYALDPELPAGAENGVPIPSPLPGQWYVGQGSFSDGSHSGKWAADLYKVNNALHPEAPRDSHDNADNFSFGEPIVAPRAGSVWSLDDANPDLEPHTYTFPSDPANSITLEIEDDIGLLFSHTKQFSIPHAASDPIARGDALAEVGNSGSTTWAHLHLEGQDIANSFADVPLDLMNVVVGLNPVADDPWRRRLSRWGIREGFLVAPAGELVPALSPGGLGLLAALVCALGTGGLRARRRLSPSACGTGSGRRPRP